jgi:T-complex protein 1 subunit eta
MNPQMNMQPQIILLREGTDTSQGKGQLISNINACQAIAEAVRTTLGPRGMDKLIHDGSKVSIMSKLTSFLKYGYLPRSVLFLQFRRLLSQMMERRSCNS